MCSSKKITKDITTKIKTHTYTTQKGNDLNIHQERTGLLHHGPSRQWNTMHPLRLNPYLLIKMSMIHYVKKSRVRK